MTNPITCEYYQAPGGPRLELRDCGHTTKAVAENGFEIIIDGPIEIVRGYRDYHPGIAVQGSSPRRQITEVQLRDAIDEAVERGNIPDATVSEAEYLSGNAPSWWQRILRGMA